MPDKLDEIQARLLNMQHASGCECDGDQVQHSVDCASCDCGLKDFAYLLDRLKAAEAVCEAAVAEALRYAGKPTDELSAVQQDLIYAIATWQEARGE